MAALCQPCKDEDKTTPAEGLCRECNETMCKTCFQHHLKARVCKNHVLIQHNEMKPGFEMLKRVDLCEKHDGQPIRYYCRKHDQVGCGDCMILGEHADCKSKSIERAAEEFQVKNPQTSINSKVELLSKENQANTTGLQDYNLQNTSIITQVREDVKTFREKVDAFLDTAQRDIIAEAEDIDNRNRNLISDLESKCAETETVLNKCKVLLDSARYSKSELFINAVTIRAKLCKIEETVKKTKDLNRFEQYKFNADDSLTQKIASKGIGSVSTVAEIDTGSCEDVGESQQATQPISLKGLSGTPTGSRTTFQVTIKPEIGQSMLFTVSTDDTIKLLKQKISKHSGIPVDQLLLEIAFTGKLLRDDLKVHDYNLHEGSTLQIKEVHLSKE